MIHACVANKDIDQVCALGCREDTKVILISLLLAAIVSCKYGQSWAFPHNEHYLAE